MTMIKRSIKKGAITGITKEKIEEEDNGNYTSHYCCHRCRKCFNTLEEIESHDCPQKG